MKSVLERIKSREQLSSKLTVEFKPPIFYFWFIEDEIGVDSGVGVADLTDEQKKAAEAKYHEFDFTFARMSVTEEQGMQMKANDYTFGRISSEQYAKALRDKLTHLFISAKHHKQPPEKIDRQKFSQILEHLSFENEFIPLWTSYIDAATKDREAAKGNALASGMASSTPVDNASN